ETLQPFDGGWPEQLRLGPLGQGQAPGDVLIPLTPGVAGIEELFSGVGSDRLEEVIALLFAFAIDNGQRLVDEAGEKIEHVGTDDRLPRLLAGVLVLAADGFRRVKCPAAGEAGEPPEENPFTTREQVVAPIDERAQRLLASQRRSAPPGEQ